MLCKWHRSTVEPAVDNFRYSVHLLAAAWALDRYIVDVWTVKFDIIRAVVRHFFQLFDASDRMLVSALTFPDIQWSSPVTVTADTPVLNILNPVAETSLTDTFRDPVDCVVVSDQIIFYFCHLDEP